MATTDSHYSWLISSLEHMEEAASKASMTQMTFSDDQELLSSPSALEAIDARLTSIRDVSETLTKVATAVKDMLQAEQTTLTRQRARSENLRQICCRLPDEILSDIFELGAPGPEDSYSTDADATRCTRYTPQEHFRKLIAIGATCWRFRTVLLNSPRCWVSVGYTLSDATSGKSLEALETQIKRTRNCLFDLNISISTRLTPTTPTLQKIADVLTPHCHRCRSFRFESSSGVSELDVTRLALPDVYPHALQHISLSWKTRRHAMRDPVAEQSMISLVAGIRRPLLTLTIMVTNDDGWGLTGDAFDAIRMDCLTRLWLNKSCESRFVTRLLERCTKLEHFHWTAEDFPDDDPEDGDELRRILNLPHLKSLWMEGNIPGDELFRITAPSLEQIVLKKGSSCEQLPFGLLRDDQPNFPSLTRLSIEGWDIDFYSLSKCLQCHTQIEELLLDVEYTEEASIEELSVALDPFASPPSRREAARNISLQYLSLNLSDWKVDITTPLATILTTILNNTDPHIDLYLWKKGSVACDIRQHLAKYESRVTFEPRVKRRHQWPNAWQQWGR